MKRMLIPTAVVLMFHWACHKEPEAVCAPLVCYAPGHDQSLADAVDSTEKSVQNRISLSEAEICRLSKTKPTQKAQKPAQAKIKAVRASDPVHQRRK